MTKLYGPVGMIRGVDDISDIFAIFWDEPLRHLSIEWTHLESFWMCEEEFLPEHGERCEYLPLLTLIWLDHEKVLK